jgi:hypothetical protein
MKKNMELLYNAYHEKNDPKSKEIYETKYP